MKLADPTSTLVNSTAAPQLSTMTSRIDPDSAARIMDMLINAYSDQRLAVVRENVSNAIDATRRAGSTEPVQITSPTLIEPSLVVSDRGTGMSAAEVEAAFLTFGGSTKRDTNGEIGGYGVGAKSPWSLSESFLIDTVKGGNRTLVRASRDLNHQVLMLDEPTSLPSGTTISIPVDVEGHISTWDRVIREVSIAHDSGMVLVDGVAADSIADSPSWIGPVACLKIPGREHERVVIRSGGTLFSATPDVTNRVTSETGLVHCVIDLPIGSFDHSLTRETATSSDKTMAAVDTALSGFRAAYEEMAVRIDTLARRDVYAAVKLRSQILGSAGRPSLLPIGYVMAVPSGIGAWNYGNPNSYSRRPRWKAADTHESADHFPAMAAEQQMSRTIVVTDVPKGRKLRGFATWVRDNHSNISRVVPIPQGQSHIVADVLTSDGTPTGQKWKIGADTAGVTHYAFDDWTEELNATRKSGTRTNDYFCQVIAADGEEAEMVELTGQGIADLGLPVFYVNDDRPGFRAISGEAVVAVYLGRRKEGPLLRAVPAAMTRSAWNEKRYSAAIAGMSHVQLLGAVARRIHRYSDGDRIAELSKLVLEARPDHPLNANMKSLVAVLDAGEQITAVQRDAVAGLSGTERIEKLGTEVRQMYSAITDAYPLLTRLSPYSNDHVSAAVDYVVHTPPRS